MNSTTGLTDEEQLCMNHLVTAFNVFSALPRQHTSDMGEFVSSLHRLQDLIGIRIVRREYPEGWATVKESAKGTSGNPHF